MIATYRIQQSGPLFLTPEWPALRIRELSGETGRRGAPGVELAPIILAHVGLLERYECCHQ